MLTQKLPRRVTWRRLLGILVYGIGFLSVLGTGVLSVMWMLYLGLPDGLVNVMAALVPIGTIACFLVFRPLKKAFVMYFLAFLVICVVWQCKRPSNDRQWLPEVAVLPFARFEGENVTIHNIRNFDYRSESEFTTAYYDRTFDLEMLRTIDFFLCDWGLDTVAHPMLSFGFEDGSYVCISIEARKEVGEIYTVAKGCFKQFELIYVVGDERDLVRLRSNYRNEDVYLYRLDVAFWKGAKQIFLDYMRFINRLKEEPRWYHSLFTNCTTCIRGHTKAYSRDSRFDWRLILNDRLDELAYERGALVASDLPFDQLRVASLVSGQAQKADQDSEFSKRIREGLPGFN